MFGCIAAASGTEGTMASASTMISLVGCQVGCIVSIAAMAVAMCKVLKFQLLVVVVVLARL